MPDKIILNIGGTRIESNRATLEKSIFFKKLLGRWTPTGAGYHFFIDRDGTHFRHILNYLRDGEVPNHLTPADVDQLIREANFYEMPEMVLQLRSSMNPGIGGRSRVKKTTKRRRRN